MIERRFDAMTPLNPGVSSNVSASGRTSPEYVSALNQLMKAGYRKGENGAPEPLLGRIPGTVDLSWARPCFSEDHPAECVRAGPPSEP